MNSCLSYAAIRAPQLALLILALVLASCDRRAPASSEARPSDSRGMISPDLARQVAELEARERALNDTVWAKEMLAQECGRTAEDFWDALNAATNKLLRAADLPAQAVQLGVWNETGSLPHDIELRRSSGAGPKLDATQWRAWIGEWARDGWQLDTTEFRHVQFDVDAAGRPSQSRFYFAANLTNSSRPVRATIEGDLLVRWGANEPNHPRGIEEIDARQLELKIRPGAPPFELVLDDQLTPLRNSRSIDPLIAYDLDGDGRSELILAALNRVYRSRAGQPYQSEVLCKHAPSAIYSAVVGDFNGDGVADFLCSCVEGLMLFEGAPAGRFDRPGRLAWPGTEDSKYVMALTSGDVDRDGDLDVFVAQYKLPYEGGQMPTPYYDANDGYPARLLLNDGHGGLTDATAGSGLERKGKRRVYSCSFADLNNDGLLDLLVVSDFAGLDVYQGDGSGHFVDMTGRWIPDPHAFGMGHALADFNSDGRLDLLMTGMPSPTASRLEHLGLFRPDAQEDGTVRRRMTYGNRLYYGTGSGGFRESPANQSTAKSGWSWGCAAFDFDNDSYPDVYISNGMESRQSVREYEGEYWLHDLYVANSEENPATYLYLQSKVTASRGRGESYGGYERNRFYLSQGGQAFQEVGHLFGVAIQYDSRNVVTDDIDGDGRLDLLVTCFAPWPQPQQALRVYRNVLPNPGHWIGFRFPGEPGKTSVGAQVLLHFGGRSAVRQLVTGDSHRAQHAGAVHFGLGTATMVDGVEIRWPGGRVTTVDRPAIDRYHELRAR